MTSHWVQYWDYINQDWVSLHSKIGFSKLQYWDFK